jgi:hypothetical protein
MSSKPKQWALTEESDKFKVYHYEAGEGSDSALWIDLRWSIKRELFTAFRSNAIDDGETWKHLRQADQNITPSPSVRPSKRLRGRVCRLMCDMCSLIDLDRFNTTRPCSNHSLGF